MTFMATADGYIKFTLFTQNDVEKIVKTIPQTPMRMARKEVVWLTM